MCHMPRKFRSLYWLFLACLCCSALISVSANAQILSAEVIAALRDLANNSATSRQKALLYANGDAVNQARLNNWISKEEYQAAQREFALKNQEIAGQSAEEVGAKFRRQTLSSDEFSPGTDSDYITEVQSADQVNAMKSSYNRRVRAYLDSEKIPHDAGTQWEKTLDTDFMADPRYVGRAEFEMIARLNNAAYTRRGAAEYERISRAQDGTMVKAEQVRAYAEEMQDFVHHKQALLTKIRNSPELFQSGADRGNIAKLMAQEQKYIERIEAATDLIRKQNGLKPIERTVIADSYSVVRDGNGKIIMKMKHIQDPQGNVRFADRGGAGSVSKRGSVRDPGKATLIDEVPIEVATADAVSQNSLSRALTELSETHAQVAAINPQFADSASSDIGIMTKKMTASEKGFLIEKIRQWRGNDFAADVAKEMRKQAPPKSNNQQMDRAISNAVKEANELAKWPSNTPGQNPFIAAAKKLDEAFKVRLGISNNTSSMSLTRVQANDFMENALPKINFAIEGIFLGKEAYDAGSTMGEMMYHLNTARDLRVPDAVAQLHFEAARDLAYGMVEKGTVGAGMAGLMKAFPTLGMVVGTYMVSYEGTRFVLENLDTHHYIDRAAGSGFDVAFRGADKLSDLASVLSGGKTKEQLDKIQGQKLFDHYEEALQNGTIELMYGATMDELHDAAMAGDIGRIRSEIIQDVKGKKPPPPKPIDPGISTGGPYKVGIYTMSFFSARWEGSVIGMVVPPDEFTAVTAQTYTEESFKAHYRNLKILREGLSSEEARRFIFLALYGADEPYYHGEYGVGKYLYQFSEIVDGKSVSYEVPVVGMVRTRFSAQFKNYQILSKPDLSFDEAKNWYCLQVKVLTPAEKTDKNCGNYQYAFQGKVYHAECIITTCILWHDNAILVKGLPLTAQRAEWILNRMPELQTASLAPALNEANSSTATNTLSSPTTNTLEKPMSPPLNSRNGDTTQGHQDYPNNAGKATNAINTAAHLGDNGVNNGIKRQEQNPTAQATGPLAPRAWSDLAQSIQSGTGIRTERRAPNPLSRGGEVSSGIAPASPRPLADVPARHDNPASSTAAAVPIAISSSSINPPPTSGKRTSSLEPGINRNGSDFFQQAGGTADDCSSLCSQNRQCKAWTWVKPGAQTIAGSNAAHCW